MYSTKLNVGNYINGDILRYSAFNFIGNKMSKTIRINDYREVIKNNIDGIFERTGELIRIPLIKQFDFYDGWFGYDDTLFICLSQIGVYKI